MTSEAPNNDSQRELERLHALEQLWRDHVCSVEETGAEVEYFNRGDKEAVDQEEQPVEYAIVEDRLTPGTWRVEAVGDEGEVYVAIFSGSEAEGRAREYVRLKTLTYTASDSADSPAV